MLYSDIYRPTSEEELIGKSQKQTWKELAKSDHNKLLFVGPSGVGKTTLSYMYIRKLLNVEDVTPYIKFFNGSDQNGIDDYREGFINLIKRKPMTSPYMIFFIDEIHRLSKPAQDVLLTPIENLPPWVIVIAATTEPEKLQDTLKSRFKICKLTKPNHDDFLIRARFLLGDQPKPTKDIIDEIITNAAGNIRIFDNNMQKLIEGKWEDKESKLDDLMSTLLFKNPTLQEVFKLADSIDDYNGYVVSNMCNSAIGIIRNGKLKGKQAEKVAMNILQIYGNGLSPYTSPKISFYCMLQELVNLGL